MSANNNPYKYTDPTGEFFQAVTVTIGALAGGYMGYKESGGSFWGTVQGAAQGAYLGIGVGGVVSGIGFVAKGVATLAKQSVWRSVGTDAAIGAVSSFSGTKATGGSNGDAFKNAGFGAVFGAIAGRYGKSETINGQIGMSGLIGSGTNALAQGIEIAISDSKTIGDFNVGSVVGSGLGGMVTGSLSYHVPGGALMSMVNAPRSAMIDTAVSSVAEHTINRF